MTREAPPIEEAHEARAGSLAPFDSQGGKFLLNKRSLSHGGETRFQGEEPERHQKHYLTFTKENEDEKVFYPYNIIGFFHYVFFRLRPNDCY